MNQLDTIKAAVAAHFAAKEAHEIAYTKFLSTGMPNDLPPPYNRDQHAAMCMLRDIMPILEAAVYLETYDITTYDANIVLNTCTKLQIEIAKLMTESEEVS